MLLIARVAFLVMGVNFIADGSSWEPLAGSALLGAFVSTLDSRQGRG